jgi:hypothetical protein
VSHDPSPEGTPGVTTRPVTVGCATVLTPELIPSRAERVTPGARAWKRAREAGGAQWSSKIDPLLHGEWSRRAAAWEAGLRDRWSLVEHRSSVSSRGVACPRPCGACGLPGWSFNGALGKARSPVVRGSRPAFSAGRADGVATISLLALLACWLMTRTRSAASGAGRGIVERVRRRRRAGGSATGARAGRESSGARGRRFV